MPHFPHGRLLLHQAASDQGVPPQQGHLQGTEAGPVLHEHPRVSDDDDDDDDDDDVDDDDDDNDDDDRCSPLGRSVKTIPASSVGWCPVRSVSRAAVPPPTCATSANSSGMREASPAVPLGPVLTTSLRTRLLMETSGRTSTLDTILEVRGTILAVVDRDTILAEDRDTTQGVGEVRDTIQEEVTPATL